MQRIDFNMFETKKEQPVSGGVISGALADVMSNDLSLKSVIKLITPGANIFWVSDGKWSMHAMLMEILNVTGAADVFISSYAMSETPARILTQLKNTGAIKKLHCVLDNRVDVRSAGSHQLMKAMCDRLVLVKTHAKVTVVMNDQWKLAVIGSANYTENERYESGIITLNPDAVDLQLRWMEKAFSDGSK